MISKYDTISYHDENMYFGIYIGLLIGMLTDDTSDNPSNLTESYIAIWNETKGETFNSTARRMIMSRRICEATFNISSSNATLARANILQSRDEAVKCVDQRIIQNNFMLLSELFYHQVAEYNWVNYKRNNTVNTAPSLMAAMYWARMVTMTALDPYHNWDYTREYSKDSSDVRATKTATTLQRSPTLLVILVVHPIINIVALSYCISMHRYPIGKNFGLISLLSAMNTSHLDILKGAGLSGEVRQRVNLRFKTRSNSQGDRSIQIQLQQKGKSEKITRGLVDH